MIFTEYIALRDKSDDSPLTGVDVELLPVGDSYPSGAITLTANASIPHQYDFPGGMGNGAYYIYIDGSLLLRNGVSAWKIHVFQDGKVTPEDTTFVISV